MEVIGKADRPNSGILVDTLHFDRSDSTLEQLDRVPAKWLHFVHVCDAAGEKPTSNEGLIFTAREDRLPPGEGEIDLVAILSHMPLDIPVGVEVPMAGMTGVDTYEHPRARSACREGASRGGLAQVKGLR